MTSRSAWNQLFQSCNFPGGCKRLSTVIQARAILGAATVSPWFTPIAVIITNSFSNALSSEPSVYQMKLNSVTKKKWPKAF